MTGTYPTSPATRSELAGKMVGYLVKPANPVMTGAYQALPVPLTGQLWPRGAGQ